jgi:hypothetical protein
MIRIPRTSLVVQMYHPAKGSKPEQVPTDVDEGAGAECSGAVPGGSILRSLSSLAMNISEPKVNWAPRGNFTLKLQGAMVFPMDLKHFPPTWRASIDVVSPDTWIRIRRNVTM